jgi:hypothetical protein
MKSTVSTATFLVSVLGFVAHAAAQPVLRIADTDYVRVGVAALPTETPDSRGIDPCCVAPGAFSFNAAATHGQAVPGGGTLSPIAFANPAVINRTGLIAFNANVNGAERNQGVFVSDGSTLTPIAMGCGGGGGSGNPGTGCGDPSPIGGTFSGFFGGTFFAPAINDDGDVLFFCEVNGGSASRGLFLYRADTGQIVKVAAIGDPSPLGGTLIEVGPGSMNNAREVVFLARQSGTNASNYYKWEAGVVTNVARVGEAAPLGGSFLFLGRESVGFADGTTMPVGLIPAITDAGEIVFWASTSGGPVERGFVRQAGANRSWIVRNTDTTPVGGTYNDFFGPVVNQSGHIAFYADVRLGGGQFTGGWFAGVPGSLRKVLAFFDPLPGGECFGLAVSRSPINCMDECGNLMLWTNIRRDDMVEREALLLAPVDGPIQKLAGQGEPSPVGGNVGSINGWMGFGNRRGLLSCGTPGAPGILNAHIFANGHLPGDLDGDGSVSLDDLTILLSNYGTTSGATFAQGDADGDGDVDLNDLTAMLSRFGIVCT